MVNLSARMQSKNTSGEQRDVVEPTSTTKCEKVSIPHAMTGSISSNSSGAPVVGSSVSVTAVTIRPAVSVTQVKPAKSRTEVLASSTENTSSVKMSLTSNRPGGSDPSGPEQPASHSVSVIKTVSHSSPSISIEPFPFKTPSPVRTIRSTSASKPSVSVSVVKPNYSKKSETPSLSLNSQCAKLEPTPDGKKSLFGKKKPAVKIASFAKTPEAERPTSESDSEHSLSLVSPQSLTKQHSSSGVSKQPMTQTSLPTPDLNAALRSYFNCSSNLDAGSPEQTSNQSDSEEEEEILVYMQFDSKLDSDLLQPHTPFKIIGVDSEKPVLQLGNQV